MRSFKDTVRARVQADPAFRVALVDECENAVRVGELDSRTAAEFFKQRADDR